MDLSEQAAVVTGASSGIGLGIAKALVETGADVALWSRTAERVDAAASEIQKKGSGRVISCTVDVRDRAAVEKAAEETANQLGTPSLLVNAAGTAGPAGLDWDVDPGEWWECVESSIRGALHCEQALLPSMLENGEGRIVEIVSVTGTAAFPLLGATSVAKTALIRHAENLAAGLDAAGSGVKVFALHPGTVKTKLLESYRSNPQMAAFLDSLAPEAYTEPSAVGAVVVRIANGDLDALSGRFVDGTADLEQTVETAPGSTDALKLRLAEA